MVDILGKPISLVNLPRHQRFWLPNRDYIYDMKMTRNKLGIWVWRHQIIHSETQRVIEFIVNGKVFYEFDVQRAHPRCSQINLYAQELAAKKYPRPTRRDGKGRKMREEVVYNVVNMTAPHRPLMENTSFLHQAQQFKAVQVLKYPGSTFEIVEITRDDAKPS